MPVVMKKVALENCFGEIDLFNLPIHKLNFILKIKTLCQIEQAKK